MFTIDGETLPIKSWLQKESIEESALSQARNIANHPMAYKHVALMPDIHTGYGCPIGAVVAMSSAICPNIVGVDIGCGIIAAKTPLKKENLSKFILKRILGDIRLIVPVGFNHQKSPIQNWMPEFDNSNDMPIVKREWASASKQVGTLGGGNHFIEIQYDVSNNDVWVMLHSGSRNIGKQVAEYYQQVACKSLGNKQDAITEVISLLKVQGRISEIESEIKKVKFSEFTKGLEYLQGKDFDDYIHDMKIMQEYALTNRTAIANTIIQKMNLSIFEWIHTTHNYIDTQTMILRKGAVSANKGQQLIIPINMRDGSLLCVGKGNEDWNCSAPHGAGRLMSRSEAKKAIELSDFQETMKNVWSTSVSQETLDESPMAYKPMDEIIENIQDTVEVKDILKPLYNFKASEEERKTR